MTVERSIKYGEHRWGVFAEKETDMSEDNTPIVGDFNPPDDWDPYKALERATLGDTSVSEAEIETATLLLAAVNLMNLGMSFDEAADYVDSHIIKLNTKITEDSVEYIFEYRPVEEDEDVDQD